MSKIVGREKEMDVLQRLYRSTNAEFVAIYGRRRVGKTFLVGELFKDKFAFRHIGLSPYDGQYPVTMKDQLLAFHISLLRAGMDVSVKCPDNWLTAFFLLSQLLEKKSTTKRQLVFIDEMPWMDTPKAGFLTAFENFWNGWGCFRDKLMLVVCGSSTSWIVDNIVNSQGGLYNRLTAQMKLLPFTLKETESFFKSRSITLSRYDIVQSHMVLGGIPYYLSYFTHGKSFAQNIDAIFFENNAPLKNEFDRLFKTLFKHSEKYVDIVRFLNKRGYGYRRDEISVGAKISKGGGLSDMLKKLKDSDFIEEYEFRYPVGKGTYYRLIDSFCLFFLKFVDGNKEADAQYWQNIQRLPEISNWKGHAFERLCAEHSIQIKHALGVSGVISHQSPVAFEESSGNAGAQVDLLIDRADNVANLCEIKFVKDVYTVTAEEEKKIEHRADRIQKVLDKNKVIHLTLVTTHGLKFGIHSGNFQKVVTLDDLFCQ